MTRDPVSPRRGRHETTDFRPVYLAASGTILVIVTIGLYVVVWGFFNYFSKPTGVARQVSGQGISTSAPRLQVDPHQDLERVRARELELLNSYGWMNKHDGVVRIPIDRAMDLVVERGVPVFSGPDSTKKESK